MLLIPLLAFGAKISSYLLRHWLEPERLRQRRAAKKAVKRISKLKTQNTNLAANIFKSFLSDRFLIEAESFTPQEAAQAVQEKTENEQLSQTTLSLLSSLENVHYSSNKETSLEEIKKYCRDSISLINSIDDNASTNKRHYTART